MSNTSPFDRATPESQGVATSAVADFVDAAQAQHLGLHSLMLLRHGRVVAEAWWQPFAPDIPHVLYSLTKSFTSTAAGFAISEGRLSLDDQVISFFPRAVPKNPSENLQALRVRHLLSMVTGHEEDLSGMLPEHAPRDWMPVLFEVPLPYPPGTHFVYNSMASHLVSIIVQKLTGQKLVNYLRDRLFRPLGIGRPYWETDPLGHNWGGWGLYLRTDEIARFGQTLLQRGMWQGRQVIPAEWVDQATRKQVSNGDDPNSDWAQGYGFQFWVSRHGYRGDGAFGQFCVVLPEQDAVLVTTASAPDLQSVLNVAWQTLLPGFKASSLPEAQQSQVESLRQRLAHLEIGRPQGAITSPVAALVSGHTYRLDGNPLGWESLRVQSENGTTVLTLRTPSGVQSVGCGMNGWQSGHYPLETPFGAPIVLPVAATARWVGDHNLHASVCYLSPAATRTFKLDFAGDSLELRTVLSGTFAPPEEVRLTGHLT